MSNPSINWTPEMDATIRTMTADGAGPTAISKAIGVSKCMIIYRKSRMGLPLLREMQAPIPTDNRAHSGLEWLRAARRAKQPAVKTEVEFDGLVIRKGVVIVTDRSIPGHAGPKVPVSVSAGCEWAAA